MQTICHRNPPSTTIHRLVDDTSPDRSAHLQKSAIIARAAGTGDFKAIQATAAGNLKMSVQEISDGLDVGAGDAGAETQRMSIATDDVNLSAIKTATEAARDRLTDNQGVALQTDAIMNDTTVLTPKFAKIAASSSGNNTLVAAVGGKKIRVLSGLLISAGTVNVRFESDADGTALTGAMNLIANVGFLIPPCVWGNFETASNTLLNLELSAAVSVDGWIIYIEI